MPIIVCFEGNLAADPTASQTPNQTAVTEAVVLINHRGKDDAGEWVDTSDPTRYHIKAWRTRASALATKHKGDKLVIIGHVRTESWTTNEGTKRYKDIVEVDAIGESLRA